VSTAAPPPEPVVLSKVVYDDGDVEVLDLVGGVEKVVLLTYVDGAATSDAELEPIFEEEDGRRRRRRRRHAARTPRRKPPVQSRCRRRPPHARQG
jgi:hypothetical protein